MIWRSDRDDVQEQVRADVVHPEPVERGDRVNSQYGPIFVATIVTERREAPIAMMPAGESSLSIASRSPGVGPVGRKGRVRS